MDLNLIRTFLTVADCQSFTLAAKQLNLTQPAISHAIKRLEKEIGKSLFVKKGRGIELTTVGYQLQPHFRQALDLIDNAVVIRNQINAFCSEALIHALLPIDNIIFNDPPLEKFTLYEYLRQQKTDLVIDSILTKDAAFVTEEVYSEPAVIICRKNHPRIQGIINVEQYYSEKHIIYTGTWNNVHGFEQIAKEPVQARKVKLVTNAIGSMAMHVSQSDSLGLISKGFADIWADKLGLQVLSSPIKIEPIRYYLIYHKRELNNGKHKIMRKQIKWNLSQLNSN